MKGIESLSEIVEADPNKVKTLLNGMLSESKLKEVIHVLSQFPLVNLKFHNNFEVEPSEEFQLKIDFAKLRKVRFLQLFKDY